MRRPRVGIVFLAALVASTVLAATPSGAQVADDALLAFSGFILGSADFSDGSPQEVQVYVDLVATQDAPEGRLVGRIHLDARPGNGTGPAESADVPFEVDIGPPGTSRTQTVHQVTGQWLAPVGLYNITATLWPEQGDAPWDSTWRWYQAGYGPTLGTGWGRVEFPEAATFDVDGDGVADVWLDDANGTKPQARPMTVYEITQLSPARVGSYCGRGIWFDLSATETSPSRVRVSKTLLDRLIAGDEGTLHMDTQARGGVAPDPINGTYETTVGAQFFGTRFDFVHFSRTCVEPAPRAPHTWGDGFRTTGNLTHWDLDQDGVMDVRFWGTNASSVEEARNETIPERRGDEQVLIAQAHVEHRTTRRILTFELSRPGGGHEGAWVEIQDAEGLFRALLEAPENASVEYELSLPANESLIERNGTTTWVWMGHFSTQTLTVVVGGKTLLAETPGQDDATEDDLPPETGTDEGEGRPLPAAGAAPLALALAALAVAAGRRSR